MQVEPGIDFEAPEKTGKPRPSAKAADVELTQLHAATILEWTMSSSREAAGRLVDDLRHVFGERLLTVAVYGPHAQDHGAPGPVASVALVQSLSGTDLDGCAARAKRWHGHGLATPLIVPVDEFHRSLDAFPLEYSDIIERHDVVFGAGLLLATALVQPGDLRRACETQVKSHLLHLRQEYLESEGSPSAISQLLRDAAPAFATLLERVARLQGAPGADHDGSARAGARLAGLSDSTVSAVLALEHGGPITAPDGARLFQDYLQAVGQLAAFVDTWRHPR